MELSRGLATVQIDNFQRLPSDPQNTETCQYSHEILMDPLLITLKESHRALRMANNLPSEEMDSMEILGESRATDRKN